MRHHPMTPFTCPPDCLCDRCMGDFYGWRKLRFMRETSLTP